MHYAEETILAVAEIVTDSAAMNDAALAAAYMVTIPGPVGNEPRPGYGAAMLRVADELERVGFEPI